MNEGGTAYDSSSKDALIQSMINLVNGIDCSNADTTVDIDFILPSSYTSESVVAVRRGSGGGGRTGTGIYTLNNPLFNGDFTFKAKVGDNFFNSLGEAGYCGDGGQVSNFLLT